MPPFQPLRDALGNELHEGDIVSMTTEKIIAFRVMKLEQGGIQTPQGMTPGVIVIGTTLTISTIPGGLMPNIARLVSPGSDAIVSKILDPS